MLCSFSILFYSFLTIILVVTSTSPENPIHCTLSAENIDFCHITNSYGMFPDRSTCRATAVYYPTTEAELINIVRHHTRTGVRMKVATQFSHSIPKLVCPFGNNGVLISTDKLNKITVNTMSLTITVESGVTLRQLIRVAAENGMAFPYTPYWWGLTIGGILGTGAHGSTLNSNGSSVHDHVKKLRIISPSSFEDDYVRVRNLGVNNEELNAAKTSLGVLGVIYKVILKLEPLFKRSITFSTESDSDLAVRASEFGSQYEFADIVWYPSQHKVVYRKDQRVASDTHGDGLNNYIPFRATDDSTETFLRIAEENQESSHDIDGKCFDAGESTTKLYDRAFGFTNNETHFTGYPVIGSHNHLQASGTCLDASGTAACAWDPRLKGRMFHQTAFSIKLSYVGRFIEDVRELVKLEPKALCGVDLYNGILMRYVTKSSSYLGKQENAIDFDFTYYRSRDSLSPRLYEDVIEEIEQMAFFKYDALPHWGKNRNVAFIGARDKFQIEEFLRVKRLFDQDGLFSSEWTDQLLGLINGLTIDKEGCALEGLCICSNNIHCAPDNGYLCREGKVYKKAKVCRYVP